MWRDLASVMPQKSKILALFVLYELSQVVELTVAGKKMMVSRGLREGEKGNCCSVGIKV